jgi:phospholipid/cholesterol/gamma-HCH transport system substrate-binding protein
MSIPLRTVEQPAASPSLAVVRRRSRRRWLSRGVISLVVLAVLAGAGFGAYDAVEPGGYQVTAYFRNAGDVLRGSVVRVDGVAAGKVLGITLVHNEAALRLQIDPQFLPLHRDATIVVRPVSLLGARYLDLNPGSPTAPVLPNGGVIPASQDSDAVNIQDLFNVLNDPTSAALAALVASLGQGVAGQGPHIAAVLKALSPVLNNVDPALKILDQQDTVLKQLVSELTPVAGALAIKQGNPLTKVVAEANDLLRTTAGQSTELGATLQELPSTLATATAALQQVGNLADQATPALASLRPLTESLPTLVHELQRFATTAVPALDALDPVVQNANALLVNLRPVVDALEPAGPPLVTVSSAAEPIVNQLTSNLNNLFGFIRNWSLVTNGSDGVSHYFRAMMIANPNIVTGISPVTIPGIGPFAGGKPVSLPVPTVSLPKTLLPNLNTLVDPVLNGIGGIVGSLLPGSTPQSSGNSQASGNVSSGPGTGLQQGGGDGSAGQSGTGLSGGQIGNLLQELIGGL